MGLQFAEPFVVRRWLCKMLSNATVLAAMRVLRSKTLTKGVELIVSL